MFANNLHPVAEDLVKHLPSLIVISVLFLSRKKKNNVWVCVQAVFFSHMRPFSLPLFLPLILGVWECGGALVELFWLRALKIAKLLTLSCGTRWFPALGEGQVRVNGS